MQTIIHTPTNKLSDSLDFYKKLNFKIIEHPEMTFVTDGKVVIEINPVRYARAGVKLFNLSWKTEVKILEEITTVIKTEEGYLLSDPSGTWIYLIETAEELDFDLSKEQHSVLGNFAGISLETVSVQQSLDIWQILGFSKVMGDVTQGWIGLENENKMPLSIMKPNSCPHLFFNPSLTYFNGKENPKIIEKIRNLNITITEEITAFNKEGIVDNIIIRDPGGYGFFIFND